MAENRISYGSRTARAIARILNSITGGAVAASFREAATAEDDDPRGDEYRRLSATTRDLMPLQFRKAQQMSFYLWQRNPIAKRMIGILVEFCTGDEFGVEVKIQKREEGGKWNDQDDRFEAQELWDEFADDPINRFNKDTPKLSLDLLINGELVLPMFVNAQEAPGEPGTIQGDGFCRMGYIDPANVTAVITNPMDVRQITALKLQPVAGGEEITMPVAGPIADRKHEHYGRLAPGTLFFRINHVVNQSRGHGYLIDTADWLDGLDQFLFDALEGIRLRNSFFYDATFEGADEEKIKEIAPTITVPANGAIRVHNEKVKYDVVTPDLKTQDIERALVAYQTFIVGAKGYPAMWFGSGAETNKATAGEMAIPTMKMIRAMQGEIRTVITTVVKFVTDQAVMAGTLKLAEDERIDIRVNMFDPEKKGTEEMAAGFTQMVQGLGLAVKEGWVAQDTAKRVMDGMLQRIGIQIDPNETVEDLKEKLAEQGVNDAIDSIYGPAGTPPGNQDEEDPADPENGPGSPRSEGGDPGDGEAGDRSGNKAPGGKTAGKNGFLRTARARQIQQAAGVIRRALG